MQSKTQSISPLVLSKNLDASEAEGLRVALAALVVADAITIDGHEVERASTACLQVLLAAALSARGTNSTLRLRSPSDALTSAFADLGLSAELNKWNTTHG